MWKKSLFLLFFTSSALADWKWAPSDDVVIYKAASNKAQELLRIDGGNFIILYRYEEPKNSEWVKVRLRKDNKILRGYVNKSVFKKDELEVVTGEENLSVTSNERAFIVSLAISQNLRGPTSSNISSTETIEFGPQYGVSFYPTFGYEFSDDKKTSYNLYASYRMSKTAAEATLKQSGSTTLISEVTVDLAYVAAGVLLKKFLDSGWWYGYGGEIAKGIAGTLKYSDGTSADLKSILTTNFQAQAALGYAKSRRLGWQFAPEIRAGVTVNGKPVTLNFEVLLGATYNY